MKMKKIFNLFAVLSIILSATVSCNKWLAVDLEDSILEDKLFETNEGYTSVLNGVYTKMNNYYGSTLSMGLIDAMAQLYVVGLNHSYDPYVNFEFEDSAFEGTSGALWTGMYNLIANLNTLLERCDEPESALLPNYYPYIKGEALALRAMLHFDLLRLYGPIYTEESKTQSAIPYQATTEKTIQPILTAEQVLNKVIKDLQDASDLLKEDAIRTDGVLNSDSEDPNETAAFRYRQYRLNYYAVQGLLARAYLWGGDKTNAYTTAKAIITEVEEKQTFNWTPKASVQSTTTPDLLFSTEVMFGLYNLKRVNLYDRFFKSTASYSNILTFSGETMEDGNMKSKVNWFYSDINDLRRTEMWEVSTIEEVDEYSGTKQHTALTFGKYKDIQTSETRRYMIPLMRMSEIYLIAAECTSDLTEGLGYVNLIREHRNCVNLEAASVETHEALQEHIDNEFYKETIGEGQIYFHYKRNAKTSVLGGDFTNGDMGKDYVYTTIALENYVWPLPEVETDKRID